MGVGGCPCTLLFLPSLPDGEKTARRRRRSRTRAGVHRRLRVPLRRADQHRTGAWHDVGYIRRTECERYSHLPGIHVRNAVDQLCHRGHTIPSHHSARRPGCAQEQRALKSIRPNAKQRQMPLFFEFGMPGGRRTLCRVYEVVPHTRQRRDCAPSGQGNISKSSGRQHSPPGAQPENAPSRREGAYAARSKCQ